MKVYESSHQTKRDYKKVPQIKIKNSKLSNSGFKAGKEYAVIYQPGKITLVLVERDTTNN
jgi:hypothetical protein